MDAHSPIERPEYAYLDGGPSEESTLHNCDGGDFVVVEGGNCELQQLLVQGEGRALLCLQQFDRPDPNS